MSWTRRDILKTFAVAGGALAAPLPLRCALGASEPDVVIRLTAVQDRIGIWNGANTGVLRYTGQVLKGRRDALKASTSYLGPTLEFRTGERVRIYFENRLSEHSIIHWHGMVVPERDDGHPRFAIPPGKSYPYEFTIRNPAGMYLYHPHPHGLTGEQVYYGLAGLLIVRDAAEAASGLPSGEQELPLVIQDRRLGDDNQLVFMRSMMDRMNGVLGDTILVNGRPDASFNVAPRPYRLRIANISNARIYKLAWSDDRPMQVVATDGGLLPASVGPQTRPYIVLAPFERIEILEDFGARRGGTEATLMSRKFSSASMGGMMGGRGGGMMQDEGMMGGMMGGGGMMGRGGGMMGGRGGGMMRGMMGPDQGEELTLARFTIAAGPRVRMSRLRLPDTANAVEKPARELYTQLSFRMMHGFLNGREFQMTAVAKDEHLPLEKPVAWTLANDGAGMAMPHPMHIHDTRFRIIERGGINAPDLRDGIVDVGFKDTVLVLPGEHVKVAFTPQYPGLFLYHCHNLEHEDGGMMRNYLVS